MRSGCLGQAAKRCPKPTNCRQILVVMRIARADDLSIIIVRMDDVPFGVRQKRTTFTPVLVWRQDRRILQSATLRPTSQFDIANRSKQPDQEQQQDTNGTLQQPLHTARPNRNPAINATPPRAICGKFASTLNRVNDNSSEALVKMPKSR